MYDCEVIGVLTDVWVEEVAKVFVKVFDINVWADSAVDTLSDVQAGATIDVVSTVGVEALSDVSANVLTSAMTDLQFVIPST